MLHDLIIYQKHYDLMLYAFPIINRFPKSQRFVLGQQIQNCMVGIATMIVQLLDYTEAQLWTAMRRKQHIEGD